MNPVNRCYLCKKHLFVNLKEMAKSFGAETVMDGTNEDDHHVYRPGIQALKELGIVSPLAQLHITKEMCIRDSSYAGSDHTEPDLEFSARGSEKPGNRAYSSQSYRFPA